MANEQLAANRPYTTTDTKRAYVTQDRRAIIPFLFGMCLSGERLKEEYIFSGAGLNQFVIEGEEMCKASRCRFSLWVLEGNIVEVRMIQINNGGGPGERPVVNPRCIGLGDGA